MPTNKQRRETARRHLERQLQRREEREARRRKTTLIASIAATVVLIAVIVIAFAVIGGSDSPKKTTAGGNSTSSLASSPPVTPSSTMASPSPTPSTSYPPATGPAVSFEGVTVKGATDLKGSPVVTSTSTKAPAKLAVKDLVVGKGKAASPTSTVTVQYTGVLYKNGTLFDSSWKRGTPATFQLGPGHVIDGFTQGIGGTKGVPAMKVGGRRIMILPAALGYGASGQPPTIPANAPLVFVVDLKAVSP